MSFKLKTFTIFLIVATHLMISITATEVNQELKPDCDTVLNLVLNEEDKMLKNYIIRYDLKEEFKTRNDNNELCFNFMKNVLAKIDYYKSDSQENIIEKKDEESQFDRDERSVVKRKAPRRLNRPFNFKY